MLRNKIPLGVFMKSKFSLIIALLFILASVVFPPLAAQADEAVVKAVYFFSPTCPHCHEVLNNVLPEIKAQYGNQIQIIGVNVATPEGQARYQEFIEAWQLPDDRLGVPAMVIGETHLLGGGEIPGEYPGIIQNGLASGGIDWPNIPRMDDILAQTAEQRNNPTKQPVLVSSEVSTNLSLIDRFQRDLVGNSLAVVVLIGMVISAVMAWINISKPRQKTVNISDWVIPVLSIIGLGVAGYLTYVEMTLSEAVCGPIGDCNTVQQSSYARLFGILPVGLLGLGGYFGILIAWILEQYGPFKYQLLARQLMWGMAFFGVLFSIYLTFLEPFVIGATCAWCLTSAIIITLQLWLATGILRTRQNNPIGEV